MLIFVTVVRSIQLTSSKHCVPVDPLSLLPIPSLRCCALALFLCEVGEKMATPAKSWTKNLPSLAARIYFLLILLQIPLFRVKCRAGLCTTPLHITTSQLIASEIFPQAAVKSLLYPGAIAHGLAKNMSIPTWDSLVDIYNLTNVKDAPAAVDLQRLEVLSGSYFCVAGALVGLLKPGRMSMFGTLLVIWGLVKEGLLGKPVNTDPTTSVYVYPTMFLAMVCAFASVKYDINKMTKSAAPRPIAKPLQKSSKSKLK